MTTEERISALHRRMKIRMRRRERRKTAALGMLCACMCLCLIVLVFGTDPGTAGGPAGLYSGATMLFENAGVYVIVALTAFFIGVIVTVACIRRKKTMIRRNDGRTEKREDTP